MTCCSWKLWKLTPVATCTLGKFCNSLVLFLGMTASSAFFILNQSIVNSNLARKPLVHEFLFKYIFGYNCFLFQRLSAGQSLKWRRGPTILAMVTPPDACILSIGKSTCWVNWNAASLALVSGWLRCCLILTAVPTGTEKKLGYLIVFTTPSYHVCSFRSSLLTLATSPQAKVWFLVCEPRKDNKGRMIFLSKMSSFVAFKCSLATSLSSSQYFHNFSSLVEPTMRWLVGWVGWTASGLQTYQPAHRRTYGGSGDRVVETWQQVCRWICDRDGLRSWKCLQRTRSKIKFCTTDLYR